MDPHAFDRLARAFSQPASRRRALSGLLGGVLATVAGPSEAKPRHNHAQGRDDHTRHHQCRKAKPTCGKAGDPCTSDQPACCSSLLCPNGVCVRESPSGGCAANQLRCTGTCTDKSPANCGACGVTCPTPPNATATCTNSVCGIICNAGFRDCNTRSDRRLRGRSEQRQDQLRGLRPSLS